MTTSTHTALSTQVYKVYIKSSAPQVWAAIVDPDWNGRYGYGAISEYDLVPGGQFRALANAGMLEMGTPEVIIDGEVIESDPPRRLVQTWRMAMDPTAAAEGFTQLTWELAELPNGVTRLTVTHELANAPSVAAMVDGGMEADGAGGGWAWILSDLKTMLETGASFHL